jgi:hypothetical protein
MITLVFYFVVLLHYKHFEIALAYSLSIFNIKVKVPTYISENIKTNYTHNI